MYITFHLHIKLSYTQNLSWHILKPSSSHSFLVTNNSGKCADRLMAAPPLQQYVEGLKQNKQIHIDNSLKTARN